MKAIPLTFKQCNKFVDERSWWWKLECSKQTKNRQSTNRKEA